MESLEYKLGTGKGCVSRDEKVFLESLDSDSRRAMFAHAERESAADTRIAYLLAEQVPVAQWPIYALERYVGGLSEPSKMPGYAYGLPAAECNIGTRLRAVGDSTCAHCYAYLRGNYRWINVLAAQYRRLESITKPLWADCMAELIRRRGSDVFRFHDSGDIQSLEHLKLIARVARLCPDVRFWIPTRELGILAQWRRAGLKCPANLDIRVSAHKLGGRVPSFGRPFTVSTVHKTADTYPNAHICPAPLQDNNCGDCRACWDRDVKHVSYHAH